MKNTINLVLGILLVTTTATAEIKTSNDNLNLSFHEFSEPNTAFGDYSTSIPIELPGGQGNLKPKLSLNYSSSAPQGVMGVGWSIGISCVERRGPKTDVVVVDENDNFTTREVFGRGVPNYTSDDTWFVDGQRLVELDGQAPDRPFGDYRPEKNSFTKFSKYSHPNGGTAWEARSLDGTITKYEECVGPVEGKTGKCCVSEISNLNGSAKIEYEYPSYMKDSYNYLSPSKISWGGPENFSVDLQYLWAANFDDTHHSENYSLGFRVRQMHRLSKILIKKGSQIIQGYQPFYTTSSISKRSLLKELRYLTNSGLYQVGNPRYVFDYGTYEGTNIFSDPSAGYQIPGDADIKYWTRPIDINCDGMVDLVRHLQNSEGGNASTRVWKNTGTGWQEDLALAGGLQSSGVHPFNRYMDKNPNYEMGVRTGDFNGDGCTDFMLARWDKNFHDVQMWIHNADQTNPSWKKVVDDSEFDLSQARETNRVAFTYTEWKLSAERAARIVDLNGDGLSDLIVAGTYYNHSASRYDWDLSRAYLNTGSGFSKFPATGWTPPVPVNGYLPSDLRYGDDNHHVSFADINGDALMDLVIGGGTMPNTHTPAYKVFINTAKSPVLFPEGAWKEEPGYSFDLEMIAQQVNTAGYFMKSVRMSDVNMDGRADILVGSDWDTTDKYLAFMAAGYNLERLSDTLFEPTIAFEKEPANSNETEPNGHILDANGDGKPDLLPRTGGMAKNLLPADLDLMVQIESPTGGKQIITYEALKPEHGRGNMPYAKVITTSVELDDGRVESPNRKTHFEYFGAKYDRNRRSFRGFRYSKKLQRYEEENQTIATESWFHQESCMAGEPEFSMISANDMTMLDQDNCSHVQSGTYEPDITLPSTGQLINCTGDRPRKITKFEYAIDPSADCPEFVSEEPFFNPVTKKQTVQFDPALTNTNQLSNIGSLEVFEYHPSFGKLKKSRLFDGWNANPDSDASTRTTESQYFHKTNDWVSRICRETKSSFGNVTMVTETDYNGSSGDNSCSSTGTNPLVLPTRIKTTGYAYDDSGTATTDSVEVDYGYDWGTDRVGNLIRETNSSGITTTRTYEPGGVFLKTEEVADVRKIKERVYDARGRLQSEKDSNNVVATFTYDQFNRPTGYITPKGRVLRTYVNFGTPTNQYAQIESSFNQTGDSRFGPENVISRLYFDGFGRQYHTMRFDSTILSQGALSSRAISVSKGYNSIGKTSWTTHPYFGQSYDATQPRVNTKYDAFGRNVETSGAGIPTTLRDYALESCSWPMCEGLDVVSVQRSWIDNDGQRQEIILANDTLGRAVITAECRGASCDGVYEGTNYSMTRHFYNGKDQLVQTTLPYVASSQEYPKLLVGYDPLGRKTWMKDPNLSNCRDTTLANARLLPALAPRDESVGCPWTYEYDDRGNLIKQTDAKGQTIHSRFDARNRETWRFTCTADNKLEALSSFEYDFHKEGYLWRERHLVEPDSSPDPYFAGVYIGPGASCPVTAVDNAAPPELEGNQLNVWRYIRHNDYGEIETKHSKLRIPSIGAHQEVLTWSNYGAAGQLLTAQVNLFDVSREQTLMYHYGDHGRPSAYTSSAFCDSRAPVGNITYDAQGRIEGKEFWVEDSCGSPRKIGDMAYEFYDEANPGWYNRLKSIHFYPSASVGAEARLDLNYTNYDDVGNIKRIEYKLGEGAVASSSYDKEFNFNRLNQLSQFRIYNYPGANPNWSSYNYDALGNRIGANILNYANIEPPMPQNEVNPPAPGRGGPKRSPRVTAR